MLLVLQCDKRNKKMSVLELHYSNFFYSVTDADKVRPKLLVAAVISTKLQEDIKMGISTC